MYKLQADLQDLLECGQLTCPWLGKQPTDPKWIAFVSGRPVKVNMGRMSAHMAMEATPFVEVEGLRIFRNLSKADGDARTVEVCVFPRDNTYVVNLLRITDKSGRGEYRSLLRAKGKRQFRFADLREALRFAMRIVCAGSETGITRVLRRAEKEMTAAQEART